MTVEEIKAKLRAEQWQEQNRKWHEQQQFHFKMLEEF
jgi:hypothetical protein